MLHKLAAHKQPVRI